MPSIHRRGIPAIVAALLLVAPTAAFARTPARVSGPLSDLQTDTPNPTDGATARAQVTEHAHGSTVTLTVWDLGVGDDPATLGAHVHVGPCVPGDGAAAGPHFKIVGPVSPQTEVWLDFTIHGGGTGHSVANVPFHIPPGAAQSIVIHALPTDHTGAAGARLACIGLQL